MKHKNLFNPFVALFLVLVLGGGVLLAGQARAQAPSEPITLEASPDAALGSAFTYQGRLLDGGTPVDGACDFEFSLWDDPSAGSQIGTTQSKSGVTVSDGYFGVSLDFGVTAFDGEARYLDITVDCDGSSTPLSPRVTLSGAPYAHSLRPGAVISGAESTGLKVETSAGGTATALLAYASSQTGQTSGVWGSTNSVEGGVGVVGRAEATSGTAYGLYGISFSAGGTGVYGTAPTTGTVGIATGSGGVGVYGKSSATSGDTAGVVGECDSSEGAGVSGYADATSGTNYGVYGNTSSPDGYGVYATNTAAGGASDEPTAIYGEVNAADGFALYGLNNSGRGIAGEGSGRYGVGGFSDTSFGVFGKSMSGGVGVMGEGVYTGTAGIALATDGNTSGVYGESTSPYGSGGRFMDLSDSNPRESAAVWAGSYWSDILRGYELNEDGSIANLRFRVNYGGEVYADGSYNTPAADFAEMLPASGDLEAGDVLVIGPDGKLARSTAAYSSAVVGVYSTQPGFVGGAGKGSTDRVPLAIMGIVPVKVSAENGSIAPGDLLVASSIPGHAMRAGDNPRVGTVIGKALASLPSGTGVIQMLVMLQ